MHATFVVAAQADREMGRNLARLRYDCLAEVLEGLLEETRRLAIADQDRGRVRLSALSGDLATHLLSAVADAHALAGLCKPWIDAEKQIKTA